MKKIILMIIAAAFVFVGCKKEETLNSVLKSPENKEMRSFNNYDELKKEVEKIRNFSLDELEKYEIEIGFNSFGKLADKAMVPIMNDVENNRTNSPNLSRSSIQNSEFLQIVTMDDGEDYCETKYYQSSFRYIMNLNRMFKVENEYFKVFEGGHVSCHTDYYEKIVKLSETDFSILEDNDIFTVYKYPEPTRGNYGKSLERTAQSGLHLIKANITWNQISKQTVGNNDIYTGEWNITTKTYIRFLWINWPANQPNNINIQISKFNEYNAVNSGKSINTSQNGYTLTRTLRSTTVTVPKGANPNLYIHTLIGECSDGKATIYFNLF